MNPCPEAIWGNSGWYEAFVKNWSNLWGTYQFLEKKGREPLSALRCLLKIGLEDQLPIKETEIINTSIFTGKKILLQMITK